MTTPVIWVGVATVGTILYGILLINSLLDLWIARHTPDAELVELAVGDVRAFAFLFLAHVLYLAAGLVALIVSFAPFRSADITMSILMVAAGLCSMAAGISIYRARGASLPY
jgi:hypothetical protein